MVRESLLGDLADEDGPSVNDMHGSLNWLPDVTTSLVTRIRLDSSLSEDCDAGNVFAAISFARRQINPTSR